MPTGLVVMHWDERVGVEILGAYPEEASIQDKTLMQLYSQHEFSGEAGLVTLNAGAVNLASYYTGQDTSVYVILILTSEEDGDIYEEGMAEIARQIVINMHSGDLSSVLPPLFQRLSVYPTLNEEQRYAMLLNSDINILLFNRLREEAVVSKAEISIWMKDRYREGFVDIESIIASLVKLGLVKIASVKGLTSDMVFLTEDLMALRIPPANLIYDPVDRHLPASLKDVYLSEVRTQFETYVPNQRDNREIIERIFLDPQCYEVLKLMREAIVTRNDLEKLKKKGVEDIDKVLKALWETKMVTVLQDEKGTEYYCLTTNFFIGKFYPRYNVDTILSQYRSKSQSNTALIKALALMKEEYYNIENTNYLPKKR